jgi:Mor family transcriptional regulator
MAKYDFKNEKNNNCKLTNDQVAQIHIIAKSKSKTYRQLAAMFNVSHAHVYKIVNGKTRQGL